MYDPEVCGCLNKHGFEICSYIGMGSFSECLDVFSLQYNQHFVCKLISNRGKNREEKERSFYNEIKTLSSLIHPNIIHIYKTFSNETHLFLILEYCPNGDFYSYVSERGYIKDNYVLLRFISEILDGLSYLESKNIVHRDIKPSNIFIDKYGRPKIADFGLSAMYEKDKLCEDYSGSLIFIAPEILNQKPYNSSKSDIWSFGVTIYYMATGMIPFSLDSSESLRKSILNGAINIPMNVNPTVRKLIENSIVVDPSKRMSFMEMKDFLNKEMKDVYRETLKLPPIRILGAKRNLFFKKAKSNNFISRPKQLVKSRI